MTLNFCKNYCSLAEMGPKVYEYEKVLKCC
nr:MAG TPA: DNA protecting protein DprA Helix, DNA BINDING PROTEIN [Caudoviricetes sp.]